MDAGAPASLCRLLALLEKPKSLEIAKRMLRSWNSNCNPQEQRSSLSCICSVLNRRGKCVSICQGFHWYCVLEYLTNQAVKMNDSSDIILNSRFTSCLSEHVQIQFLNLLISLHKSIPKEALKNFVEQLQSETSENNWTNFLLRKLTALVTDDTSTTLPAPTIDRISSVFNPHINEPLESVTETVHCRKRKMDLETAGHDDAMGMDDIRQKTKYARLEESPSSDNAEVEITLTEKAEPETTSPKVLIPNDTMIAIESIKSAWAKGQKASSELFLKIVIQSSQLLYSYFQELSESSIMAAIANITDGSAADASFQSIVCCLECLIVPHLLSLQKQVSRSMLASVGDIVRNLPMASVDGLLYPLMLSTKFNTCHSELLGKLFKDTLTSQQRDSLWSKLTLAKENSKGEQYLWNEQHIQVLQLLIDKGVTHIDASSCAESLQANAGYHTTSLRFAKLLLILLSKHGREFTDHIAVLNDIISGNNTSLKNKLQKTAEKNCKKSNGHLTQTH